MIYALANIKHTNYTETTDVIFAWYVWHVARRVFQFEDDASMAFHPDTIDHLNTLAAVGDLNSSQDNTAAIS